MRIISGSARGRKLLSPEGYDVRPTADKVKESMFNIIQFELADAVVLDLFSGTGQLGIEALSRGAEKAVFVDSSRKSLETVKKNIGISGFDARAEVVFADAMTYLASSRLRFDIVFLDPPYHKGLCVKALELLPSVLSDHAVVICETQCDEELPPASGEFLLAREYKYSAIKLSVYRRPDPEEP